MRANSAFDRYEAFRDYEQVVKTRQANLPNGSDDYEAQKSLGDLITEILYEAGNCLKDQVPDELSARKYRADYGWQLPTLDDDELNIQTARSLQDYVPGVMDEVPRDGTRNTSGDRGSYDRFRLPVKEDGGVLPFVAEATNVDAVLQQVKDFARSHGVDLNSSSDSDSGSDYDTEDLEPEFAELVEDAEGIGTGFAKKLRQYVARTGWQPPEQDDIEIPIEEQFDSADEYIAENDVDVLNMTDEEAQHIDAITSD